MIGINGKTIGVEHAGGAVRVARRILEHMAALAPKRFTVFAPLVPGRATASLPRGVALDASVSRAWRGGVGRSLWEQTVLPTRVNAARDVEVLLSLTNSAPAWKRLRVPQIVLIHDAGFLNREWFSPLFSRYLEWSVGALAARGATLVTVSEAAADDLAEKLRLATRPTVIHNGCDDPAPGVAPADLPYRYFLFLGSLNPRKNLDGALRAFQVVRRDHPHVRFLVVGAAKTLFRGGSTRTGADMDGVEFLGPVDDRRKWALLAGAVALVFPSFLEGFGLPAIEAMKVGTPVIASDIPVFRELLDDAALLPDPTSVDAIADAMRLALDERAVRERLIASGRIVAVRYSWDTAARQYLRLVESTVSTGR